MFYVFSIISNHGQLLTSMFYLRMSINPTVCQIIDTSTVIIQFLHIVYLSKSREYVPRRYS